MKFNKFASLLILAKNGDERARKKVIKAKVKCYNCSKKVKIEDTEFSYATGKIRCPHCKEFWVQFERKT